MTDPFYRALEDRFRGSREEIKWRLRVYLDFLHPLKALHPDGEALDLGCGRGEWLEFLRERGISASGVDMDDSMLAACRALGLAACNQDAISRLQECPDQSMSLVTAFHLVEHLKSDQLRVMLKEAYRVLKPGGLLIAETPNPENLVVATSSFYIDPSHERPIPPTLLSFLCEFAGFQQNKVMRLQQAEHLARGDRPTLWDVLSAASPDYAVVALKGGAADASYRFALDKQYGADLWFLANQYEKRGLRDTFKRMRRSFKARARKALIRPAYRLYLGWLGLSEAYDRFAAGLRRLRKQHLSAPVRKLRLRIQAALGIKSRSKHGDPADRYRVAVIAVAPRMADAADTAERQLFVDVSSIAEHDYRTGIQRVVRSIVGEWLRSPPEGFRIELVRASETTPYRYARSFAARLLDPQAPEQQEEEIQIRAGDIFLGLDLCYKPVIAHRDYFRLMRARGVSVQFVVYDLLPVAFPHHFSERSGRLHLQWLDVVLENDVAISISHAVSNELRSWAPSRPNPAVSPTDFRWFHLGADIRGSVPSRGFPVGAETFLSSLLQSPSFLMVGTLEPRKGHLQTLAAFDKLWARGVKAKLIIVGREGWMVKGLTRRLRRHPELGDQLHWIEGPSDQYLEEIYARCACLISASEGEGFGLPLIEAAQHGLPIIARDLPVFREVAGEGAMYFSGDSPQSLAECIAAWLAARKLHRMPSSARIAWLTWAQSAEALKNAVTRSGSDWRLSAGQAPNPANAAAL